MRLRDRRGAQPHSARGAAARFLRRRHRFRWWMRSPVCEGRWARLRCWLVWGRRARCRRRPRRSRCTDSTGATGPSVQLPCAWTAAVSWLVDAVRARTWSPRRPDQGPRLAKPSRHRRPASAPPIRARGWGPRSVVAGLAVGARRRRPRWPRARLRVGWGCAQVGDGVGRACLGARMSPRIPVAAARAGCPKSRSTRSGPPMRWDS